MFDNFGKSVWERHREIKELNLLVIEKDKEINAARIAHNTLAKKLSDAESELQKVQGHMIWLISYFISQFLSIFQLKTYSIKKMFRRGRARRWGIWKPIGNVTGSNRNGWIGNKRTKIKTCAI